MPPVPESLSGPRTGRAVPAAGTAERTAAGTSARTAARTPAGIKQEQKL